ncbi:L,D-transpeptidase family protein [Flavobacterium aquicola]|uniref:L,D-transpeptidase-like protein n=1 Tax=Flavobacterium aquicola TaxID=1682742 RepID=A0A3E0E3S8_9FLAO|nr:L,D-transpeptidase family protein [Flavobacterium aquicola]REG92944.1 L,D-transpeptidase-like protein [Flavobacterium aquicola]
MRNFNLLLGLTVTSLLLSSFSYDNKKTANTIFCSQENMQYFENNTSQIFFDRIYTSQSLINAGILKPHQNDTLKSNKVKSDGTAENQYALSNQYAKLQKVLEKYQIIEKNNQWKKIDIDPANYKELKPTDSGAVVRQIRERLFIVGDLKKDSKSEIYDEELMAGVLNYKKRYGLALNYQLTLEHINQMNEPISNRIKTIKLNMERCREMPANLTDATEYIIVNIPSYRLFYIKDGKSEFESDVFVGAKWSETEVLSSMVDKIVFSPYWNIPQSIIDNELKLKMYADKNYLEENNMEWNGGRVRQKPGPTNSLGLVKFMFPNQYDIYMHDTPAKSLFLLEKRTFSHGCVNIKDAKGLAQAILKNDPDWTVEKIDTAMNGEKETPYELKNKIPIYMSYFTAWVSYDTGEINFFDDIYDKDRNAVQLQNSNSVVMD